MYNRQLASARCPRHPDFPATSSHPRPSPPRQHFTRAPPPPRVRSCGSSSPLRKKKKSVKKHRRDRYLPSPGASFPLCVPRAVAVQICVPEPPQTSSRELFCGPPGLIPGPGGRDDTGERCGQRLVPPCRDRNPGGAMMGGGWGGSSPAPSSPFLGLLPRAKQGRGRGRRVEANCLQHLLVP